MSRPTRLDGFSYMGPFQYFLTFCACSKRREFLNDDTASETLAQFRRAAADEGFGLLAYCLMPDYVHLLVEGMTSDSNLRRFAKMAKQRSGAAHSMRFGRKLWQEGYFERVLRADEDGR